MAIFTKESSYSTSYNVRPTNEAREAICLEATREINSVFAGLYVAAVRLEQKALLEGADVNILMENILNSAWSKLKEIFKKFKDKIMSWFNAIKKYLITLFTSGRKFAERYGKDVINKANDTNMDKFEYEGYPKCDWKKEFGENDTSIDKINELTKIFTDLGSNKADVSDDNKEKTMKSLDEKRKTIDDAEDENTESKVEERMMGDKKKLSYSEGMTAKNMVDFIMGAIKSVDEIEQRRKRVEKNFDDAIKAMGKNEKDNDKYPNKLAIAKEITSLFKKAVAEQTRHLSYIKKGVETFTKQCARVIKKIFNYRPAKESVEIKIEGEADLDVHEAPEVDSAVATVADPEENLDGISTVTVTEDLDMMEGDEGEDPTSGDVTEDEPEAFLESCMKFF